MYEFEFEESRSDFVYAVIFDMCITFTNACFESHWPRGHGVGSPKLSSILHLCQRDFFSLSHSPVLQDILISDYD